MTAALVVGLLILCVPCALLVAFALAVGTKGDDR